MTNHHVIEEALDADAARHLALPDADIDQVSPVHDDDDGEGLWTIDDGMTDYGDDETPARCRCRHNTADPELGCECGYADWVGDHGPQLEADRYFAAAALARADAAVRLALAPRCVDCDARIFTANRHSLCADCALAHLEGVALLDLEAS